jgi:hypothetical protein
MFEEGVGGDQPFELAVPDEVVMNPILFPWPRRACGVGNRQCQPLIRGHQRLEQTGLAGA